MKDLLTLKELARTTKNIDIIKELSTHEDKKIRKEIAKREDIPVYIYEKLITDKDKYVTFELYKNKNTPKYLKDKIFQREDIQQIALKEIKHITVKEIRETKEVIKEMLQNKEDRRYTEDKLELIVSEIYRLEKILDYKDKRLKYLQNEYYKSKD
jgi:glucosamine 6-phosphate synthetase-like amidotransferase/phosphosugar isomerase protein